MRVIWLALMMRLPSDAFAYALVMRLPPDVCACALVYFVIHLLHTKLLHTLCIYYLNIHSHIIIMLIINLLKYIISLLS